MQQIILQRDLRLLDQAEKHWAKADEVTNPVAVPRESFNFLRKKIRAPIEGALGNYENSGLDLRTQGVERAAVEEYPASHGQAADRHTIEQALAWPRKHRVVFSTDGEEIAEVARRHGADVPFMRPEHLATDTIGKMPVLIHAFEAAEAHYQEEFDILVDLDPTAPLRRQADLDLGLETFLKSGRDACISVVKARKNPYFNMVERDARGDVVLSKTTGSPFFSRQASPQVWI